jgi:hypothetical protein
MDKKLQKIILQKLIKRGFCDLARTVKEDVCQEKFEWKESIPSDALINHQIKILEDQNKIIVIQTQHGDYYKLTLKGQQFFDPWYKKTFRFILFDKHNLFILLSFLISVLALIFSIID